MPAMFRHLPPRGPAPGASLLPSTLLPLAALALLATCGGGTTGRGLEGNLLAGRAPLRSTGVVNASRLTDGKAAHEGDFWQTGLTTRLTSHRAEVVYDLGEARPITCALLQGDNNDHYRVDGALEDGSFTALFDPGPADGPGMRVRQGKLDGKARFVRLSARGGDGFYSVSELAVFSTCPPGWPALDLPRATGVPLTLAARNGLILFAIIAGLYLALHRRQEPRWARLLALAPIAAFVNAVVAVAAIYPFANTDEESLVRGVVALLAGVLVVKESFVPQRWRPDARVSRGTLGLLAVLALGCYYHFGSAQFMDVAKGRLTIVHTWDMRNYFPSVKYFKELRFDGVYLACLAAYVDLMGNGDPATVRNAHLRDLDDYHMMTGAEAAPRLPEIRARFTPERWEEFKRDMKYFIDTMGPRDYLGSMQDHGGNATPVWMLPAWLIYKNLPASEWTLGAAGFIDPVLLIIFFVILARTFGVRVMLYTVILFGATDFYQFGSNLMGSTLRQDWLVALGLGACALKKNRPFLGGFLLAYGGLIRAFPALAALFLLVPLALFLGGYLRRERRVPGPKEILARQGPTVRAIAGAAVAVVGLLVVTSAVFGYQTAWGTWLTKIEMHAVGPSTNNVGLRNVLAYRPADSARALVRRQVPDTWVEWDRRQVENFRQLRPLFYLLNLAAFGLLVYGVARRPLHQTSLLGLLLVPFFFYPSNYYCHFVFLLPMAVAPDYRREPGDGANADGPEHRMFGFVTAIICAMSVGQYFTMLQGWTDERYTQQSYLLLSGFAAIITALAVEARRSRALEAAPAAGARAPAPQGS